MAAPTIDEMRELGDVMRQLQRKADQAYDDRQVALYAVATFYALAFVDSYFLFPQPSEGGFASFTPFGEGGPELALSGSDAGVIRLAVRLHGPKGGER